MICASAAAVRRPNAVPCEPVRTAGRGGCALTRGLGSRWTVASGSVGSHIVDCRGLGIEKDV